MHSPLATKNISIFANSVRKKTNQKQFISTLCAKLSFPETQLCLPFTHPLMFEQILHYGLTEKGKEKSAIMTLSELQFRVVKINDATVYVVAFPAAKMDGIMDSWQNPGTGPSLRLAEHLLENIDALEEVACGVEVTERGQNPPDCQGLLEGDAHGQLRKRILHHLQLGAQEEVAVKEGDIYLYPTGMATIFYADKHIMKARPGKILLLGSLFHNTYHHLFSVHGTGNIAYFPLVEDQHLSQLESTLEQSASLEDPSQRYTYLILEFPSNPLLQSPDLRRVQSICKKHGVIVIIDDTIGSFSNVDVLPYCDVMVTSLTKTFSGYADVMAGSTVLNPGSQAVYELLKPVWEEGFRNELFVGDAEKLLGNSEDYLARSKVLGENAERMAKYLHEQSQDSDSPIDSVLHPAVPPCSSQEYNAYLRRPTEAYTPTYPCLLTINFKSLASARAFYEATNFYPGPHLGAHKTLSLCYNTLAFGKKEEVEVHRKYGILEEAVRISVGLEAWEDLRDTLAEGLEAGEAAWRAEKAEGEGK